MKSAARLLSRYTEKLPPGRLEWIGLRPQRRGEMQIVEQAEAIAEQGLAGDHRSRGTAGSSRQVTLIALEEIELIARYLGLERIAPELLRRNLVVSGINLHALRHQRFRIGDAEFEATAYCHPCSRMEQALGKGAVAAMIGHGGICAKVVRSGRITLGDRLEKL
ncbi:MOSC domain-containing protein [Marinobacterium arenosum]|uniref:MOSC domain-containing protein n=1 Tax=Marinobacterium arenosum TaxID=2862496 RepID=UPI001C98ACE5|nr:MOSC domain-containing protein [Marinobacterium arenosum]MBY4674978.1 MOSC domain-containing protein [Marinobacterium arenosum]